jgi:hypothetical protein
MAKALPAMVDSASKIFVGLALERMKRTLPYLVVDFPVVDFPVVDFP